MSKIQVFDFHTLDGPPSFEVLRLPGSIGMLNINVRSSRKKSPTANDILHTLQKDSGILAPFELCMITETTSAPFISDDVRKFVANNTLPGGYKLVPADPRHLLSALNDVVFEKMLGLILRGKMHVFASVPVKGALLNAHIYESYEIKLGGYNIGNLLPPGSAILYVLEKED